MLGLIVGSIPFVVFLVLTAGWIYFYVYDHNIIRTFTGKLGVSRDQINNYIDQNVRIPYHIDLTRVNVDENEDFEDFKPKIPVSTATKTTSADNVVGIIFTATIALGIQLIILMMCELVDYFRADVRLTLFKITIDSLMLLLTLAQPFLIISLIVNLKLTFRLSKDDYKRALTTFTSFVGWLFFLHKCGDLSQSFKPPRPGSYNPDTRSIIDRKINEVSIAGITILAVLSGIGCTSTPYKLFALDVKLSELLKSGPNASYSRISSSKSGHQLVTESDINSIIMSFNNTNTLITKRQLTLNDLEVSKSGTIYNNPSKLTDNILRPTNALLGLGINNRSSSNILSSKNKFGGIMHKVQSFASLSNLSTNNEDSEEGELRGEIESLKNLKSNIYDDLLKSLAKFIEQQQLHQRHQAEHQQHSQTFNRVLLWCNNAFAVYCIYRVINVVFIRMPYLLLSSSSSEYQHRDTNIIVELEHPSDLQHTKTSNDALAITLAKLILSIFPNLPVSETQLINQLGFILSGSLFICSFSNVLITFKSFTRFLLPSNRGVNYIKNWLKHLVIAELLGVYIIATALLIRTNLPSNLSHQISKILSLSGSNIISSENSMKEVEFIDNWFDKVFAISCIATLVLIVIKKKIIDVDVEEYDEEMYIESSHVNKLA